jgi:uncharacterized coiled-coil DUF342 family protein
MSDRRTARRNLKRFLATAPPGDTHTSNGVLDLADLRVLLRAEKAHRSSIRYLSERMSSLKADVQHLRAKNDTYVQRLKDWDAQSPATLSAWKNLQEKAEAAQKERDTAVQELAETLEKIRRALP